MLTNLKILIKLNSGQTKSWIWIGIHDITSIPALALGRIRIRNTALFHGVLLMILQSSCSSFWTYLLKYMFLATVLANCWTTGKEAFTYDKISNSLFHRIMSRGLTFRSLTIKHKSPPVLSSKNKTPSFLLAKNKTPSFLLAKRTTSPFLTFFFISGKGELSFSLEENT